MINGISVFADELDTARTGGGFRSKMSIDDSPVPNRVVSQAVARAKEGDREAVRFLYLRYADNVYGYVRSIVRDDYEAEDVTQHVFAKLMTVIGKYEERDVAFSAWIIRVARNVAVDHMRQRRPIPSEEVREAHVHDEGETSQHRSLILRDALKTLPDEQREVLVLRHLVGTEPRRDRRSARQLRAVDPRPAPPRPRRPALCPVRHGVRPDRRAEGGRVTALRNDPIPVTRLDQADPALLEELLAVVERVARAGAFTFGAELESLRARVRGVLRDRPGGRRLQRHRGHLARAARARDRRRRRGHRPDQLVHRHGRGRELDRRDAAPRRRRSRDAPDHARGRGGRDRRRARAA